jgi:hypothetical protein
LEENYNGKKGEPVWWEKQMPALWKRISITGFL